MACRLILFARWLNNPTGRRNPAQDAAPSEGVRELCGRPGGRVMTARSPRHPAKRPYVRSGLHVVRGALPVLLARVTDPAVPDGALSPVEQAARDWRAEVLADLGGPEAVPAAKRALLDAATGTKIILDSIDRYVFELAAAGGLVSRRTRTAFRVVSDRGRVADSLVRQLAAVGLDRVEKPALDLGRYLSQRYAEPAAPRQDAPEAQGMHGKPEDVVDHGPADPAGATGRVDAEVPS